MDEIIKKLEEFKNELKALDFKEIENTNSFLTSKKYDVKLNNGKTIRREKLLKNNQDGSAVIILPITTDSNVILTIEPRVFTKDTVGIGIPAGYIENNETSMEAAIRELKEETGFTSKNIIELTSFYQDQGISSAYNTSFLALDCIKEYDQNLDKDEYIKYIECPFDTAYNLMLSGYINDANGIITLMYAKNYLDLNKGSDKSCLMLKKKREK